MNWQHAKRIAWKDMRRLSPFALALAAFWILWLGGIAWMTRNTNKFLPPFDTAAVIWGMLCTTVLYTAAWGSLTFSLEHEDNAFPFLRSLPVNAKSVFYGKLAFGVLSTLALAATLAGVCGVYEWLLPNRIVEVTFKYYPTSELLGGTALFIPVMLANGMFWSQRIRRPMQAFIATAATPFTLTAVAATLLGLGRHLGIVSTKRIYWNEWQNAAGAGIAVATLGLICFVTAQMTANTWLRGPESDANRLPNRLSNPFAASTLARSSTHHSTSSGLRRLLWLQRRSNRSQWILLGVNLAVLAGTILAVVTNGPSAWRIPDWIGSMLATVIPCVVIVAALSPARLGLMAFRDEHTDQRFRLLAQVGAKPFPYWCSRLLIPCLAPLILIAAIWIGTFGFGPDQDELEFATVTSLMALATFSIAQFHSLAWRSIVYAFCATLVSCVVLVGWMELCQTLELPILLAFLPIIGLPLLASYLRIPRWFRETGSWRQWMVPAIPLVLLLVGLPLATAIYRVIEIPTVTLPEELLARKQLSDKDRASVAAYERVFAKLPDEYLDRFVAFFDQDANDIERIDAWMEEHPDVLKELIAATEQGSMIHTTYQPTRWDGHYNPRSPDFTFQAAGLLIFAARQAEESGDLEQAWRCYVAALRLGRHANDEFIGLDGDAREATIAEGVESALIGWAMHNDNTPERIEKAIVFLNEHRQHRRPWTKHLNVEYLGLTEALDHWSQFRQRAANSNNLYRGQTLYLLSYLPTEKWRNRRLNDFAFNAKFQSYQQRESREIPLPPTDPMDEVHRLAETTFSTGYRTQPWWFEKIEQQRRGMLYQLAAIAIHKKLGKYPAEFSDLKVGNLDLPDIYGPGKKLVISTDTLCPAGEPVSGLFLRTSPAFHGYSPNLRFTASDANGDTRHFVLPDFENYSRENFQRRVEATSFSGRRRGRNDVDEEDREEMEDEEYDAGE